MPDIDVDFAPEGRQKAVDYVIEKYGKEMCVPDNHIWNYGSKEPLLKMSEGLWIFHMRWLITLRR